MRVGAWLRSSGTRVVVLAVVLGVAAAAPLALVAGARRTGSAPDRLTASVGGDPTAGLNQFQPGSIADDVRALPGVDRMEAVTFVTAFVLGPDGEPILEPNPFAGDGQMNGASAIEGRLADAGEPDEFVVTPGMAELMDGEIGRDYQVVAYSQVRTATNDFFESRPEPDVGPFTATLVGVVDGPTGFEDPAPAIFYSPGFLAAHPDVGQVATLMNVWAEPGLGLDDVMEQVRTLPGGESVSGAPGEIVTASNRRAVGFHARALWVVAGVTAVGVLMLAVQTLAPLLGSAPGERAALRSLGWRRRDFMAEAGAQGLTVGLLAAPVAAALALAASPLFPLGQLDVFEPSPGFDTDVVVVLLGAVAVLVVCALLGVLVAAVATDLRPVAPASPLRVPASLPLAATVGSSFALRRSASGRSVIRPLMIGMFCCAGLVGAGIVGLSILRLSDERTRVGENFDALFGNPFLSEQRDILTPALANPSVEAVTAATLRSLTIGDRDVPLFAFDAAKGGLAPVVLDGRAPSGTDEISLGREVARRLDLRIGDTVDVTALTGASATLRVVGITVVPEDAGAGVAMAFDGYAALVPDATRDILLVRFGPDAPADAVEQLASLSFTPPGTLTLPTGVKALDRVATMPFAIALILGALLAVALYYHLFVSLRDRAGDLAVLRALGADNRDVRSIVHAQATVVALLVLAVGLPVGFVVGRGIFAALANRIGVVSSAVQPLVVMLAAVGVALVVTNLAATIPARRATRTAVAWLFRDAVGTRGTPRT